MPKTVRMIRSPRTEKIIDQIEIKSTSGGYVFFTYEGKDMDSRIYLRNHYFILVDGFEIMITEPVEA